MYTTQFRLGRWALALERLAPLKSRTPRASFSAGLGLSWGAWRLPVYFAFFKVPSRVKP